MFKTIVGFDNYEVNEYGEVRNKKTLRVLKHNTNTTGHYHRVWLCKDGKRKVMRVHRIVLMTFEPVEGMENLQVNHKDENKDNNCLSNLEWCDSKYNNNYGTKKERISKPINQYDLDFNYIKTFPSVIEAAKEVGGSQGNISHAANGDYKTSCGYKWRLVKDTIDGIIPKDNYFSIEKLTEKEKDEFKRLGFIA